MIENKDRKYWFGASDTKYVMNENHSTATWQGFWAEKCGVAVKDSETIYTATGTAFEHPILDAVDKDINKDRQIILEEKRIRVNYDGDKDGIIFEVKTHKAENDFMTKNATYQFLPKHIYGQVQVQMYVWKEAFERGMVLEKFDKLYVLEYPLYEADFVEETDIDFKRIKFHKVKYDKCFIKEYKKKLEPLTEELLQVIRDGEKTEEHIF